jgi:hypothetical protein
MSTTQMIPWKILLMFFLLKVHRPQSSYSLEGLGKEN